MAKKKKKKKKSSGWFDSTINFAKDNWGKALIAGAVGYAAKVGAERYLGKNGKIQASAEPIDEYRASDYIAGSDSDTLSH